jgi:hypothetical protein
MHAATSNIKVPVHAAFNSPRGIKVKLYNDSGAPLDIKAGDVSMTIPVGKTITLTLPAGTKVVTASATAKMEAGALIAEIAPYLEGSTLRVK